MENFFKGLNFNQIIRTEDASYDDLSFEFTKVSKILSEAHRDKTGKTKTVLFVYYSGHGVMDTTTKVVCNEFESEFRYFPLESKLSVISGYQNTFVVTVFDCCREELPREEIRGGADKSQTRDQNFYVTFGCAPTNGVPTKSTLVDSYVECL